MSDAHGFKHEIRSRTGDQEPPLNRSCQHKRLVDYILSEDGQKTGNIICAECGAIFPDPVQQEQGVGSDS